MGSSWINVGDLGSMKQNTFRELRQKNVRDLGRSEHYFQGARQQGPPWRASVMRNSKKWTGTWAIRRQITLSKPKWEIIKITNRQNTMRTNGQPSGQLFPKRWSLSNPNRTKSIMNKHKVKHHRKSDTKTGTTEPHPNRRLVTVSNELLGGEVQLVLRRQPHPQLLTWYKHLVGCSVRMIIL